MAGDLGIRLCHTEKTNIERSLVCIHSKLPSSGLQAHPFLEGSNREVEEAVRIVVTIDPVAGYHIYDVDLISSTIIGSIGSRSPLEDRHGRFGRWSDSKCGGGW